MALTDCTMLAVAWKGPPYNKSVKTRPMPTIVNETDPIVRLSSTAVCGTDLHVYHSLCGSSEPGRIMGHEGVGYVDSIGSAIKCLDVGDYVVIPDNFGSSHYPERFPSTRLTQGYGQEYTKGGDVGGCQAEYVCILFADDTLYPIPKTAGGTWSTSKKLDYIMISDVFATA